MVWGETVRGADVAVHAQESCGDFAADLLRSVYLESIFSSKGLYSCMVAFFRQVAKDLGSKNNLPDGTEVPVREFLISSPATALLYNLGPGWLPLLALRFPHL